jgi:hypothetical protein
MYSSGLSAINSAAAPTMIFFESPRVYAIFVSSSIV